MRKGTVYFDDGRVFSGEMAIEEGWIKMGKLWLDADHVPMIVWDDPGPEACGSNLK